MKSTLICFLLLFVGLCERGTCQVSSDFLGGLARYWVSGPAGTALRFESSHTASPGQVKLYSATRTLISALNLPVQHVTFAEAVGVDNARILCGGFTFSGSPMERKGVLFHVDIDQSVPTVSSSQVFDTFWPMSSMVSQGTAVVLDGRGRRVVSLDYDGQTLPDPSQGAVLLNGSNTAGMDDPGYLSFWQFAFHQSGDRAYRFARGRALGARLAWAGGGWQVGTGVTPASAADQLTASGTQGFEIRFPANCQSVEIRNADNSALLASVSGSASSWVQVPPIQYCHDNPGTRVRVEYPGNERTPHYLVLGVRYGQPLSLPELEVGNLLAPANVDLPMSGVGVSASCRPNSTTGNVLGVVSLAFRGANGDPVQHGMGPNGEQSMLTAQATLVFSVPLDAVMDQLGLLLNPIAADPSYDGMVLLSQITLFGANNAVGVTDVVSTTLRYTGGASAASSSGPASSSLLVTGQPTPVLGGVSPNARALLKRARSVLQ